MAIRTLAMSESEFQTLRTIIASHVGDLANEEGVPYDVDDFEALCSLVDVEVPNPVKQTLDV